MDAALVGLANPSKKKSNNLPSKYNHSEALDQQIFWIKNLWRVSFFLSEEGEEDCLHPWISKNLSRHECRDKKVHLLAIMLAPFQCQNVLTLHTFGGHYPWHTSALICKTQSGTQWRLQETVTHRCIRGCIDAWQARREAASNANTIRLLLSVLPPASLSAASTPTGRRHCARRRRGSLLFACERARRSDDANVKLKRLHLAKAVKSPGIRRLCRSAVGLCAMVSNYR